MFDWENMFLLEMSPEWSTLTQISVFQAAGIVHLPDVPIFDSLHGDFHLQTVGILHFHMTAALPNAVLHFYHHDAHRLLGPSHYNTSLSGWSC